MALAYKGGAIIESCFRRMKQTGLEVRPMFHWAPRRIEAHVKLCVLALQVQRTAEIRTGLSWARIAHLLGTLKAVRYLAERQTIAVVSRRRFFFVARDRGHVTGTMMAELDELRGFGGGRR